MVKADKILDDVMKGKITKACFDCADEYRAKDKSCYALVTTRNGVCDICKEEKQVGSPLKLFGYYQMIY